MDLEEAINLCTNIINSCDDLEEALEWTFPDEASSVHAAITLVEEAQHGLSQALNEPLDHERKLQGEEEKMELAQDDYLMNE